MASGIATQLCNSAFAASLPPCWRLSRLTDVLPWPLLCALATPYWIPPWTGTYQECHRSSSGSGGQCRHRDQSRRERLRPGSSSRCDTGAAALGCRAIAMRWTARAQPADRGRSSRLCCTVPKTRAPFGISTTSPASPRIGSLVIAVTAPGSELSIAVCCVHGSTRPCVTSHVGSGSSDTRVPVIRVGLSEDFQCIRLIRQRQTIRICGARPGGRRRSTVGTPGEGERHEIGLCRRFG